MIDESTRTDTTMLSPRAAIALLSLQLRSTVQEAIEAEAAADAIDVDGALWQLRSRLTPLIDERRRALEEEVALERARAAEAIAAAHVEAEEITNAAIEAAAARALAERAAAELAHRDAMWQAIADENPIEPDAQDPEPLIPPEEIVIDEVSPDEETPAVPLEDVLWGFEPVVPFDDLPEDVDDLPEDVDDLPEDVDDLPEDVDDLPEAGAELQEAGAESVEDPGEPSPLPPPLPGQPCLMLPVPLPVPDTLAQTPTEPAPDELWARTVDRSDDAAMHVTLDADSFARAFAAAMAPILEARERQAPQYVLPPAAYLQPQAPPPKRSFWAHAWHPDVLLSGLAMVIVIIVLVAWTG
jgi:hypothetical protein